MFEDRFYVYRIIRPIDLTPIYIGQGQDSRIKDQIRNLKKGIHLNKGLQEEYNFSIEKDRPLIFDIVAKHLIQEEAQKLEIELIMKYGRLDLYTGTLYNKTDGGSGPSNRISTEKQINSRKTVWLGRKHSEETKKRIGAFHKGRIFSSDTIEKMRIAAKNRPPRSQETIEKMRIIGKSRTQSEETKEKLRKIVTEWHRVRKEKINV